MTTTNHPAVNAEPDDELIVIKLLDEMILEERWEVTDLGRARLQESQEGHHRHNLELCPFGKDGAPLGVCADPAHLPIYGAAIWHCLCGYVICRTCFEVQVRRRAI